MSTHLIDNSKTGLPETQLGPGPIGQASRSLLKAGWYGWQAFAIVSLVVTRGPGFAAIILAIGFIGPAVVDRLVWRAA